MPDWLIQVLVQFPIVVVIGFVGWYAYRKIERNAERFLTREDAFRAKFESELRAAHQALIEAKNAEIKRLDATMRNEIKKVAKAVDELTARLGG
jgi:hypothetical protein